MLLLSSSSSSSVPQKNNHSLAVVVAESSITTANPTTSPLSTSHSNKKNKRKRKNKSSLNSVESTLNGSSGSTDQQGTAPPILDNQQQQQQHTDQQGSSSLVQPLVDDHHQQQGHIPTNNKVLTSHSKGSSTTNGHTRKGATIATVVVTIPPSQSNSSSNNKHNNQKQASKKNKQQSSSSKTIGGANSKAGSLRGSHSSSSVVADTRRKGSTLNNNKEINVNNHESKSYSPSHRQLLKKVRTKVSTVNYSQVLKYKCLDSDTQGEQELTMKKTSITNMAEIANVMNRRAQYLMKYIGFKTEKTCFFDIEDEVGFILHEHVAEVKKELTENNGKYVDKDIMVKTLNGSAISMNDENQMSKLIDQILHSYISNYMVCPSCKSIKTTNPIVVDNDQQQRILQEFKDDNNDVDNLTEYQEEQLIERLDDFTFFTIQCRECEHKERIDNANSSDEFIKQILKSRQRNLSKLFKQGSNYQNEENYVEHESVPQPVYGYPYQTEPPVYYYPYYVDFMPGDHNVYAPAYYPPPMPNYYGYYPSFYPTQPLYSPHYDVAANQESNETIERDPHVEQNYKSAGVIAYCVHQGKVYFLLGKENRGGKGGVNPNINFEKGMSPYKIAKQMFTWSEFGGKKEKTDTNSAETAAREFYEETKAAFGDIYDKLANTEGYYFENGKYNLFITELEYLTNEEIQERSTIDSSSPYTEKVDLAWIDADELMTRINDRTKQYFHTESGLMKIPVNGNENEFLHPFALSLFRFSYKTLAKVVASIKN